MGFKFWFLFTFPSIRHLSFSASAEGDLRKKWEEEMKARMLENEQEMINMKKSYEEKLKLSQKDSVVSNYCCFCKTFNWFSLILVAALGRENILLLLLHSYCHLLQIQSSECFWERRHCHGVWFSCVVTNNEHHLDWECTEMPLWVPLCFPSSTSIGTHTSTVLKSQYHQYWNQ